MATDTRNCALCRAELPTPPTTGASGSALVKIHGSEVRICYPCADARQRAELATAEHFFAYLSGDSKQLTTWTGGLLARVTRIDRRRVGFGGERFYFRAVSPDGSRWYGNSPGPNMYARMHRAR